MKTCRKCGESKPLDQFWKKHVTADGRDERCKGCRNAQRNRHPNTKARKRRAMLKSKYGVTPEWYDSTLADQGGVCASCGNVETRSNTEYLAVDHNHKTDEVRGILCQKCNTALGLLNDDPGRIAALLAYIKRY